MVGSQKTAGNMTLSYPVFFHFLNILEEYSIYFFKFFFFFQFESLPDFKIKFILTLLSSSRYLAVISEEVEKFHMRLIFVFNK
jgi:hypothetical protein